MSRRESRVPRLPSVSSLRLQTSWTRWRQSRATRRLAKQLARTQALLGLLAQREAKLQVALQLQGLTLSAQQLRVREMLGDLLADPSTQAQLAPPPEPPLPVLPTPQELWQQEQQALLPVMHRPETLPEEPMPPAEEQLVGLLRLQGSSTPPSSPSSES